jgi:hypothetical protein
MAAIRAQRSRSYTLYERYRELESSHHEISKWVGRARNILVASNTSSAPETYLAATRAVRALMEAWTRHIEFERSLFPWMLSRDLHSAECLEGIARDSEAIARQMAAFLDAPWPRSPQAGLQSIQSGVTEVLAQLLAHIEQERVTISPAILLLARRGKASAHGAAKASELVAS